MNQDDYDTITAMQKYGGNFIKTLAGAYIAAGDDNRKIIRDAFSEYWKKYAEMGAKVIYRTFADGNDEWRWDGKKMQTLDDCGWCPSLFRNPEELLACMDVTETTLPEFDHESPERDPIDVAHEDMERRLCEEDAQ